MIDNELTDIGAVYYYKEENIYACPCTLAKLKPKHNKVDKISLSKQIKLNLMLFKECPSYYHNIQEWLPTDCARIEF